MPAFTWLAEDRIDIASTPGKIKAMKKIGVKYQSGAVASSIDDLKSQAHDITLGLNASGIKVKEDREIIALIAYIQRLGTDILNEKEKENETK
jgi:cytochrome c oxidase cbb3-type subunit I/II